MFKFLRHNGDFTAERLFMVENTIIRRGITDVAVIEAMRKVPRHLFVPEGLVKEAYEDTPLPIGHNQTISQPYIVALMAEAAKIDSRSKVLEIGTGSGYAAAVLAEIVARVFTIEIIKDLILPALVAINKLRYDNIEIRVGDGNKGWPDEAPFDAIILSAAPEAIPNALVEQLSIGGRLIAPVGGVNQMLKRLTRLEDRNEVEDLLPVRFVPMIGGECN